LRVNKFLNHGTFLITPTITEYDISKDGACRLAFSVCLGLGVPSKNKKKQKIKKKTPQQLLFHTYFTCF
jgi:hypothetical protein